MEGSTEGQGGKRSSGHFDFGRNWRLFSELALTPDKVLQAKNDFVQLMDCVELQGKSFLDIGFGQGLGLLIAASMGANTVGCEIDPECVEVLERNKRLFFPHLQGVAMPVVNGSFLEDGVLTDLRRLSHDRLGLYDVVHSWGVLHHTGNMRLALNNAAQLVRPGGYLILAIYNRHWSSPLWFVIKYLYNLLPHWLQQGMVFLFYPLIYLAKLAVTSESPRKQTRGMDFYYNVIDWVGGFPYEYASREEIISRLKPNGFELQRFIKARMPTGCNEFIFKKTSG